MATQSSPARKHKPDRPNRDKVTTIADDGSRVFLHPSDVKGRYTLWRRLTAFVLIAIYLALPWIPINGHPAVFLDVASGRFHLFGVTFASQDMWMLFFLITGLAFFLFFVTALFGRLWCGWACPQTVFLEHVYRRIERLLEGDAPQRRRLDKAPWDGRKTFLRGTKYAIFLLLSAVIAHLFLAYFISIPELYSWMRQAPTEHWPAFLFVVIATAILFVNFAWFREQLCIVICPYGRMQSILLDDHSVNIAYDEKRGEPRGKATDPEAGDCIDCDRCVQVCPTGIDIRQGLQLECVACSNCVDACDAVMDRLNRPRGLIRYASDTELAGGKTRYFRPRIFIYLVLMLIGSGVALGAFSTIRGFNATLTRMPGPPAFVTDNGIRNQFNVRLINKENTPATFRLEVVEGAEGLEVRGLEGDVPVPPMGEEVRPLILSMARSDWQGPFTVVLHFHSDRGGNTVSREVEFVGPDPRLFQRQEEASSHADAETVGQPSGEPVAEPSTPGP